MRILKITRGYSKSINIANYGGPESWVRVENQMEAEIETQDEVIEVAKMLGATVKQLVIEDINSIVDTVRANARPAQPAYTPAAPTAPSLPTTPAAAPATGDPAPNFTKTPEVPVTSYPAPAAPIAPPAGVTSAPIAPQTGSPVPVPQTYQPTGNGQPLAEGRRL